MIEDAVLEAGRTRLRPILMTTFTMIVGMLPTALAVTAGSETRSSMAWVIIGGLLTSTIFTLLVMPMIFLFFENHSFLHFLKKRGRKNQRCQKVTDPGLYRIYIESFLFIWYNKRIRINVLEIR